MSMTVGAEGALRTSLTSTRTASVAASARPSEGTRRIDVWMLGAAGLLLGLGLVLVYSASSVFAAKRYGEAEYFLTHQAAFTTVGLVLLLVAVNVSSERLMRWAPWLFSLSVVSCALVLIPGIGRLAGGARRWLAVGPVGFQPSEVAKLALVVVLAFVLARRDKRSSNERPSLLPAVLLSQIPVALTLAGPDLGTALVMELVAAAMIFAAGLKARTLLILALMAMPVLYHLVVGTPWRMQRFLSFIDPWAYRSTVGYQITESLISIGSGGITGVGLGGGKHKLFFLPEAHTDFIFSILAEELGLIGVIVTLAAFSLLVWRGFRLAVTARNAFDSYLAVGLTSIIGIPAVFNAAVATGLLPTKGLPLPLISYGGSNLVVTLVSVGLLLRISRDSGSAARNGGGGEGHR